jgi:hypothetical protein
MCWSLRCANVASLGVGFLLLLRHLRNHSQDIASSMSYFEDCCFLPRKCKNLVTYFVYFPEKFGSFKVTGSSMIHGLGITKVGLKWGSFSSVLLQLGLPGEWSTISPYYVGLWSVGIYYCMFTLYTGLQPELPVVTIFVCGSCMTFMLVDARSGLLLVNFDYGQRNSNCCCCPTLQMSSLLRKSVTLISVAVTKQHVTCSARVHL